MDVNGYSRNVSSIPTKLLRISQKKQQSSQKKIDRDTLDYLYKNRNWFNKAVKKENAILLEVLDLKDNDSIKKYLSDYLTTKEQRISKVRN